MESETDEQTKYMQQMDRLNGRQTYKQYIQTDEKIERETDK